MKIYEIYHKKTNPSNGNLLTIPEICCTFAIAIMFVIPPIFSLFHGSGGLSTTKVRNLYHIEKQIVVNNLNDLLQSLDNHLFIICKMKVS